MMGPSAPGCLTLDQQDMASRSGCPYANISSRTLSPSAVARYPSIMHPVVTVVDVGARWGVADSWHAIDSAVRVFGFDPDPVECQRLNALLDDRCEHTARYVPVALGATTGVATLFVTEEPACSSLYPPIPQLADRFTELACIAPRSEVEVQIMRLDEWCAAEGVERIDFMKLDTQGSELGVLQGAGQLLDDLLLLEIEVEFNPIYVGQPLFGDVDAYMRQHGFVLWRLDNMVHYSTQPPEATPTTLRSYFDSVPTEYSGAGGQLFWGHAYFVRGDLTPASGAVLDEATIRRACMVAAGAGLNDLEGWLQSVKQQPTGGASSP